MGTKSKIMKTIAATALCVAAASAAPEAWWGAPYGVWAPALVAHPNGAVVPADEPAVVAARADHFAAKGLAYGKRSADSEAYYGGLGYAGYGGLGYAGYGGYGYGKRSADSEAYYGGLGYAGYGGLGYAGYGGYAYGKRSADSEAYYGGLGYTG